LSADNGAAGTGFGLKLGDGGIDGDGLGGGADLEGEIDALLGADGDAEGFTFAGLEAAGFGGELVFAEADGGEFKVSLVVGGADETDAGSKGVEADCAPLMARPWGSRTAPRTTAESNWARAPKAHRSRTERVL